jgi:hypothetical protein
MYFIKGNHVCLKENAVPICPDTKLSWFRTVFFNGCRNVLVPNCLVTLEKAQRLFLSGIRLSRELHGLKVKVIAIKKWKFGTLWVLALR